MVGLGAYRSRRVQLFGNSVFVVNRGMWVFFFFYFNPYIGISMAQFVRQYPFYRWHKWFSLNIDKLNITIWINFYVNVNTTLSFLFTPRPRNYSCFSGPFLNSC